MLGEPGKESNLADLTALQVAVGVTFCDLSLLQQALVHSSYTNENTGLGVSSNERLEFLGDAILGYIIAEKLYCDFPQLAEGEMTRFRAALVRQETLALIAKELTLGDYLFLGRGEEKSGGRSKVANLARALEALIAAIFLDQGMPAAKSFVLRLFNEEIEKGTRQDTRKDYKSQLQELVQLQQRVTPNYKLVEAIGPEHHKVFTVEVMAGDVILGRGSGKSKKEAEARAARSALQKLAANFTE